MYVCMYVCMRVLTWRSVVQLRVARLKSIEELGTRIIGDKQHL